MRKTLHAGTESVGLFVFVSLRTFRISSACDGRWRTTKKNNKRRGICNTDEVEALFATGQPHENTVPMVGVDLLTHVIPSQSM